MDLDPLEYVNPVASAAIATDADDAPGITQDDNKDPDGEPTKDPLETGEKTE